MTSGSDDITYTQMELRIPDKDENKNYDFVNLRKTNDRTASEHKTSVFTTGAPGDMVMWTNENDMYWSLGYVKNIQDNTLTVQNETGREIITPKLVRWPTQKELGDIVKLGELVRVTNEDTNDNRTIWKLGFVTNFDPLKAKTSDQSDISMGLEWVNVRVKFADRPKTAVEGAWD